MAQVGGSTYDPPSGELRFHDCSTEIKEATLSVEQPAPLEEHVCDELLPAETRPNGEDSLELVDVDAEGYCRQQTTDQHGRPIRHPRYWRTFCGATITVTARCTACGDEITFSVETEEQASNFQELV